MSEDIRHVCRRFGLRVVFRSGRTLRTVLSRAKYILYPLRRDPGSCTGYCAAVVRSKRRETSSRLETRVKEHGNVCRRGMTEKSAVAEHAWIHHLPVDWEGTLILVQARGPRELLLKEAMHIQRTPVDEQVNRDRGLELPGCWTDLVNLWCSGSGIGRV